MNNCFNSIAEYMDPNQVMQVKKKYVKRFFPRTVKINGVSQYRSFFGMCRLFDSSNLEEVHISNLSPSLTDYNVFRLPEGIRKVTLDLDHVIHLKLPKTVIELTVLNFSLSQALLIPNSVRKLTLGPDFDSIVYQWSENLEELRIDGWCRSGRWPVPIEYLPNSIKRITLNAMLDIEIHVWPENLEELILEGPNLDPLYLEQMWVHAELSDKVNVVFPTEEADDAIDYLDPTELMWP
jgi:hypothetical protein